MPMSVCTQIRKEAEKYINNNGWLTKGPVDSRLWLCYNELNNNQPINVKVSKKNLITCDDKICLRFKKYKFCQHTIAIKTKINEFEPYIAFLNKKSYTGAAFGRGDENPGLKRKQTQIRKGQPNKKKCSVAEFVPSPFDEATPSTSQSDEGTNQNNQAYPSMVYEPYRFPPEAKSNQSKQKLKMDPNVGEYILNIHQLCHGNVEKCYGCGQRFCLPHPPKAPFNLIIVSKMKRRTWDESSNKYLYDTKPKKVYFHFDGNCIQQCVEDFDRNTIKIPNELKEFLLDEHKNHLKKTLN